MGLFSKKPKEDLSLPANRQIRIDKPNQKDFWVSLSRWDAYWTQRSKWKWRQIPTKGSDNGWHKGEPKALGTVKVEIYYDDGSSEVATSSTKYVEETDSIEIRSYGFHFSQADIKMRIGKKAIISKNSGAVTSNANKASASGKYQVTCAKGKEQKTIYSNSKSKLVCPKGWKKA